MSWALRELSKHDKSAVEKYMEKYNDKLAGRVRREVYTKLNTGKKNIKKTVAGKNNNSKPA